MKIVKTPFKDLIIIRNKRYDDSRGYFRELLIEKKINKKFCFSVISASKKNVIRGLHFQSKNKQTKVIHVIKGKILDVIVNLKKNSKEFGKVKKYKLNAGDTLIVPNYYAHGYECLSDDCIVLYHLDNYRHKKEEGGIFYKDKELNISWNTKKPIISKRDRLSGSFLEFKKIIKTL